MPRSFYLLLALLLSLNLGLFFALSHGAILGTTQNSTVTVTASVDYCPNVWVIPEKRIPPTHNNSVEIDVAIRPEGSSIPIYTTTVTTDAEGYARICPISTALITKPYYDILIKGISHLRHNFAHQKFSGGVGFTLDLRSPVLFAGDSHPTADNYVNALDISYEITKLYTNDLRADLNRDSIVNSLEFPTLISHLYSYGDE